MGCFLKSAYIRDREMNALMYKLQIRIVSFCYDKYIKHSMEQNPS